MSKGTKIEVPFVLGEKVLIKPLDNIEGRIKAIWVTAHGTELDVRYASGGKIDHDYFLEDELKKIAEEKKTGF